MTFRHQGEDVSIVFRRRPLAFRFRLALPIVVSGVVSGGAAEELGVKEGMELLTINGKGFDGATPQEVGARARAVPDDTTRQETTWHNA